MPYSAIVAKELAEMLGVLSHPYRIRIIEELRDGEHDVQSIQAVLGIAHSGVSQHLMALRARRLVSERRQGRQVFYRLRQPELAIWLTEAMHFLEDREAAAQLHKAIKRTRAAWTAEDETH